MAVEESLKNQVEAMLGWAIEVASDLKKQNKAGAAYSLERLRNIDLQGRKLEYRGSGLQKLPQIMPDVQDLEKEITSARAAAETVSSKLKKLKDSSSAAERQALIQAVTPDVASMVEMLKRASSIVEQEPWINPLVLRERIRIAEENKDRYFHEFREKAKRFSIGYRKLIEMLIAGRDYYRNLTLKQRQDFWREMRLFGKTARKYDINSTIVEEPLYHDVLLVDYFNRTMLNHLMIDPTARYEPISTTFLDLRNENLNSVEFSSEIIDGVNFNGAKMSKSVFDGTIIHKSSFQTALQGASFKEGTIITGCNFASAILPSSVFDNVTICGSNFDYARVQSAQFNKCRIYNVSFNGLLAVGVTFNEISCSWAGADFSGADFSDALFKSCQLGQSKFIKANFTGATIVKSSFSVPKEQFDRFDFGCDLTKAVFKKATLQEVDLERAKNLDKADLRGAKYDRSTKWPAGFDPMKAGAILI